MLPARLVAVLAALLFALGLPGLAAAAGARPALAPAEGEVIVRFKSDAGTLRQHAMSARAGAAEVGQVLGRRAALLGARHGRNLAAGHAVGERTQVMRASGVSAETLALQLAADPEVEYAVPNGRMRVLAAPNDPLYPATAPGVRAQGPDSGQWYLRRPTATEVSSIDIETAWAVTTGSASTVVAVLDTGVRREHPDLNGRLLQGYDFVSDATVANDGDGRDADPSDPGDWVTSAEAATTRFSGCTVEGSTWHGTSTASLVGAASNDGIGMAGTAPGVKVLPVRVLGKCFGTDADIQAGMLWAAGISVPGVPDNTTPARVINLSLGGSGPCSASYQSVINQVRAAGAVVVAAAGNSAGGPVGTPANCAGVISVLALRHAGTKVGFSDLGPQITIAAPGGNCINTAAGTPCLYPILAASNSGTTGPVNSIWTDSYKISVGTSFAAPLVAGTAGLMFSAQPALTPDQVATQLQVTARAFPSTGADNGPGDSTPVTQCHAPTSGVQQLQCYCTIGLCGAGMLNAGAAVAGAAGPLATISVVTAAPLTAGNPITLSAAGSLAASGSTITAWAWTLADGGGIVSAYSSATNASTATLTPSAAGTFVARLTVTDNLGRSGSGTVSVTVTAVSSGGGGAAPSSSGGGGVVSWPWLAALALAAAGLLRGARRRA
jgi:serine protease